LDEVVIISTDSKIPVIKVDDYLIAHFVSEYSIILYSNSDQSIYKLSSSNNDNVDEHIDRYQFI